MVSSGNAEDRKLSVKGQKGHQQLTTLPPLFLITCGSLFNSWTCVHVTPGTCVSALRGAPPSGFGPSGGQLLGDCHDSASVKQQMQLNQQLAAQQQLRLRLPTGSSLHRLHQPKSFSAVFLWLLSHQWSQKLHVLLVKLNPQTQVN